jgi:flavin-dependent dehydrogenase
MRAELDQLLAQAAQTAGADFWEAHPVTAIQEHRDDVDILAKGKEIRAKFVIAADGVHSATAKAGGWPPLPVLAPALEYELQLAPEDFARYAELPRFDFDAIKAGYAWVFPKRQHLSVGVLSTRRTCPDLPTRLADYLRRLGITRVQKTERHGYLIPLAPRPGPLARGRILLAGDAAGLVDPVTAEGISHAIFSGQLAAQALVESRLDSTTAGSRYQALLEDKILGELRAARFLARILYHHPRIRNGVFRMNGQRLCDFVTQVITGESSYLGALKRPASYFKVLGW